MEYEVPQAEYTYEVRTIEARYVEIGDILNDKPVTRIKDGRTRVTLFTDNLLYDASAPYSDPLQTIDNPYFETIVSVRRPIETPESRKLRTRARYNNRIVEEIERSWNWVRDVTNQYNSTVPPLSRVTWANLIDAMLQSEAERWWWRSVSQHQDVHKYDHVEALLAVREEALHELVWDRRSHASTSKAQNLVKDYNFDAATKLIRYADDVLAELNK